MPVVGTAGHVDHGKSTLTMALSGRDPDRWVEEKQRGLTIDLGFAWTTLDDGTEISFVDVPGHERYSKNMLAGIEAIDVALLVVAADEGWMPQSEEHLAVLDLLGVRHAVVALAKIDRVDAELAELATLEIEERLTGTSLEHAPIVPVSAHAGSGLDELRKAIGAAVRAAGSRDTGRPRLWVDRVFTATGAGTVVTGTLLDGAVHVDDRLTVYPGRIEVRVRSIQSHESSRTTVEPQRRVALNVAGLDVGDVARGAMVGRPGDWRTTSRIAVSLRTARYVDAVTNRGAYHFHVGSGAWPIRLRMVGDDLAVIDLPSPLPLRMGDRYILRDTGRRMVVAGGVVLDPDPPRTTRLRAHAAALLASLDAGADARAAALLAVRGRATVPDLSCDSGGGAPPGAVVAGELVFTVQAADDLTRRLEGLVDSHHRDHPLRPGLPTAEAASRFGVSAETIAAIAARSSSAAIDGAVIRSTSFAGGRTPEQQARWEAARSRLEATGPAGVPRVDELGLGVELVHALAREGELVRVSDDFVFLPEQVDELLAAVRGFDEPFTVSEFKDRTGLSRKYAIPFLEWTDRGGHTVRLGDRRRPR